MSEGLVHISDPPLHSRGNFLDSVVALDRRLLDYIVGLDTEINELVDGSVRIYIHAHVDVIHVQDMLRSVVRTCDYK